MLSDSERKAILASVDEAVAVPADAMAAMCEEVEALDPQLGWALRANILAASRLVAQVASEATERVVEARSERQDKASTHTQQGYDVANETAKRNADLEELLAQLDHKQARHIRRAAGELARAVAGDLLGAVGMGHVAVQQAMQAG